MVPRMGFTFTPFYPPEQLRAAALAAEAAGLDEFWLWEDCFSESGIACAGAVLGWTERIPVKIGLIPAPLRNVALLAMEIASLHRLFPGRFTAGIGNGVQSWMAQAGVRAASPLTLLGECTRALRQLLDGETVTVAGRYVQLDGVRLDWPPPDRAPLLLGGDGPKVLRLSVELGDGVMLSGNLPHAELEAKLGIVAAAAAELGQDPAATDVTTTQMFSTGPGADDRVARMAAHWKQDVVPGVGVTGDAEQVAASVRDLAGRGITAVTFMPGLDEPDLPALIAVLGEARQLLSARP